MADIVEDVMPLSFQLGCGIEWVSSYSQQLERGYIGIASRSETHIVNIFSAYGSYYKAQFAQWTESPLYRLGQVGAPTGGREHARWLVVNRNRGQLRVLLGKELHILPKLVKVALDDPDHTSPAMGGPLRFISEATESCREL
eukprot:5400991-Prymnesium_polylepis.1